MALAVARQLKTTHNPVTPIKDTGCRKGWADGFLQPSVCYAESPKSPSALTVTHSPRVCLSGTQITCFPPTNLSMRQAVYIDSFCWAAVQRQDGDLPLWLHKVLTYRANM